MLRPVDIRTHLPEVLRAFGGQNALLTAGDRTAANTMTIGWCQAGRLWNLPVCTVYVRPERYTYGFMEAQDYFTVSVLPAEHRKTMALCGSQSGRDVDKFAACGLTLAYGAGDAPYPEQAELVLVCRKLYVQDMDAACVRAEPEIARFYGEPGGWHRIYTGQIVEIYSSGTEEL